MSSPVGLHIGRSLERRAWFAREARFTEPKLGVCNRILMSKKEEQTGANGTTHSTLATIIVLCVALLFIRGLIEVAIAF
jgi:hypothetical protein